MGRKAKTPYMQMNLDDRFLTLSKRGQDQIINSRLGHFGDKTFNMINPDAFLVLYSDGGRGPSYLQGYVGAYLIKNMLNITVDEFILRVESDIAIQYALHTTGFRKQPFSRRNFFYFIAKLEAYEAETGISLIEKCFECTSSSMARDMGLTRPGGYGRIKKRSDSMMVRTHAAHLTRPGIVYAVNHDAPVLYNDLCGMDHISPSLYHYFDESDRNAVIYHNKESMGEKLASLITESCQILELMEEDEWHDFQEYKNLVRCIEDQTRTDENGKRIPKSNGEIDGSSLQSPKAPDATARTKAGKTHVGFVANVTETYDDEGNSLITDADIQKNTHSDADFMRSIIEAKDDPETEEQHVTDGAYYSSELAEEAAEKGILLVPTSLTGKPTNPICADFQLSADGKELISCPNGCKPIDQSYDEKTGRINAKFLHSCCDSCPLRDRCIAADQKRAVKVSISRHMVNRAALQSSLNDGEHKKLARERNAVEAIPSILRRKYGLDNILSFATSRIRSAFFAMCIAYNGQKHKKFLDNHRVKYALA